jgi:DNA-directed RNA polymerase sigma subunit (sigma70/sigma32)
MTLEEVASLPGFGVTRERVRQIEEKAIRTIRRTHSLKSQLEDYALAG